MIFMLVLWTTLTCRDKGWGGVDEGALCLSSLRYDHAVLRNPDESRCDEDKHKAPTLPLIHSLSLQDGETRITEFDCQNA